MRTGGKEEVERRKEEEEEGKGETASQRGEKVEVGLEVVGLEVVENTQLTSRLARSLESQVIILCRPISSLLKHDFLMTMATESKGTLNIK